MSIKVTSYVSKAIIGNAKGVKDGNIKVANLVVNQAKANANFSQGYQTGQTRAGLMWSAVGSDGGFSSKGEDKLSVKPTKNKVIAGVNNDHAVYLEYGTRNMASQPFLRPAISVITRGKTAVNAMIKAMNESVKRAL